jgi:ABC-type nitrate/sulfonate/bicarbonate transport system permease component
MRRWYKAFVGVGAVATIVLVWESFSRSGILSPLYLPAPSNIALAYRPQLGYGILVTTGRALLGYVLGLVVAYIAHFLCVAAGLDKHLDTQLTGARAVPIISVLPLFIIWFGFSEIGRLVVVVLATTAFFMAPVHEAYRLLPRQWVLLRKQLSLTSIRYYVSVALPGGLAALAAAFRIALAVAFTMSIASEYIGAQIGIGKFLDSARITFNVPAIVLTIILCSIIGIALDWATISVYRRVAYWAGKQPKL